MPATSRIRRATKLPITTALQRAEAGTAVLGRTAPLGKQILEQDIAVPQGTEPFCSRGNATGGTLVLKRTGGRKPIICSGRILTLPALQRADRGTAGLRRTAVVPQGTAGTTGDNGRGHAKSETLVLQRTGGGSLKLPALQRADPRWEAALQRADP